MAKRAREKFVHILYELTLAVGITLDLDHEVAAFMGWIRRFLSPRMAVLFLADEERQYMQVVAAHPPDLDVESMLPVGVDPWNWLADLGIDVDVDEHTFRYAVPISAEGEILGMICLVSSAEADKIADERKVVETGAGYFAPVLRNIWRYKTLEAQVAERTAALAKSQAMFRSVAEQSIVGISLVTPERFIYANQALADMCGYPVSHLLTSLSPLDLVHPEDRPRAEELMYKCLNAEVEDGHYTFRMLHRDGHLVYVEVFGRRIEYNGRPVVLGISIDITERVQAEEAYRALVEHSLQGLVVIQAGRVVFANPAFLEGIGRTQEEVIGCALDRLMEIVHPEDRDVLRQVLESVLTEGGRQGETVRFRFRRSDGKMRWGQALAGRITYRGKPAVQVAFLDVTRQVEARKALERYAAFLEARNVILHEVMHASRIDDLLGTAIDLIMESLDAKMGAVWISERLWRLPSAYKTVRGAPPGYEEHLAKMIESLPHEPDMLQKTILIQDISEPGQAPHPAIQQAFQDLGIRSAIVVPLFARDRRVGGLAVGSPDPRNWSREEVGLVEAIGKEIGIAVERLRLIADLEEALRAKDEMIQDVSHELRTPLTMILGYVELLQEGMMGDLTGEQAEALRIVHRNAERLRFMIDRLLLLRSLDAGQLQREQFAVKPWLREVFIRWQPQFQERDMRFHLDIAEDVTDLYADRRLLDEVLDNLLHNAVKFSPQGGTVWVRAWQEGRTLMIAVSDEGVGIPPDRLDRIFERFYQVSQGLSRRFDGMGIGLALCKKIVELHGGRIWAESEGEGKGSTFYIALPV